MPTLAPLHPTLTLTMPTRVNRSKRSVGGSRSTSTKARRGGTSRKGRRFRPAQPTLPNASDLRRFDSEPESDSEPTDSDEDEPQDDEPCDIPSLISRKTSSSKKPVKGGRYRSTTKNNNKPSEARRANNYAAAAARPTQRPVPTRKAKGGRYCSTASKNDNFELPFIRTKDADRHDSGIDDNPQPAADNQNDIEPSDIPSVDYVLRFGLLKVGFSEQRQHRVRHDLNMERFTDHFGIVPKAVRAMYKDIKKDRPSSGLTYLLLALNWLKLYDTEHVLSGRWKFCEDHLRVKLKGYARHIQSLRGKKIVFRDFEDSEIHWITVDTVNFRTQEFRLDPSEKWFDYKSHSSGLKYEFAVALRRPDIVWIRGPVPAGEMNDYTMFRGGTKNEKKEKMDKNALYFKLPDGKKAIGDSGYEGMPEKVTVTRDGQSKELKQFLGRAKNRQESLHSRLKSFGALNDRFRHGKSTKDKLDLHQMCVDAVCVAVQYDMENGRPIYDM